MLSYRKEMYPSVEEKFIINGEKYSVYVKGHKEITDLIIYLGYDFVNHQSMKGPGTQRIQSSEFVVNCNYKLSLVASYPDDNILGFPSSFENDKVEALPLFVFMDKNPLENYPEYLI
jgi:hypothetical protein